MRKLINTLKEKWAEYILEILVITIGIVGAFLLNNWNENVKANNQQKEIISNLHEEFETNLVSLEKQITRLNKKIRACSQIQNLTGPSYKPEDTILVDTLIQRLYDNPTWNPSTYVISDLRNSGQLKSLKNERLKELLHEWEQHYENLKEWYGFELMMYEKFVVFMNENGSARNAMFKPAFGKSEFSNINEKLFEHPEFENQVAHALMVTAGLQNIYQTETVELIDQLLEETE